jgi:hypothetical protein
LPSRQSDSSSVVYCCCVHRDSRETDRQTYLGKQLLLDMRLYTPRFDIRTP